MVEGVTMDKAAMAERMRGAEIINALLAHADCQVISADRVVATLTIPGKVLDDAFALVASVEDFEP